MLRSLLFTVAVLGLAACSSGTSSNPPMPPPATDGSAAQSLSAAAPAFKFGCPSLKGADLGLTPDGDFNNAPKPPNNYLNTYAAGQYIPNTHWIVTQETVELYGKFYRFPDKICSVDLDGSPGNGGIEHDPIATTPGTTYTVGFFFSGNGSCGPTTKTMQVTAAGQTSPTFSWTIGKKHDAHHGAYASETWQFLANDYTTSLAFTSLDPVGGNCGPVVTAISVNPVSSKS